MLIMFNNLFYFYNQFLVNMKIKTAHIILSQAVLMVTFLVLTAWFNRFSADDYFCIGELRNFSFFEIYKKLYLTWTGRWTLYFVILLIMKFSQFSYFLFLIGVTNIFMLFYSVYCLFRQLNLNFMTNFSKITLWTYAIIFSGVFFFFTHSVGQSWFWISASLAYLWSCIFFIYGLSRWLKPTHHFIDYLIIVLCGLYIGGSNEVLALATILVLIIGFYAKIKRLLILVPLVAVVSSFSIYYFSPGTAYRDEITSNLSVVNLILYVGYGTMKYLIIDGYKTILPAVVFGIPFIVLGKNYSMQYVQKVSLKNEFIKTIGFVVIFTIFNQFVVIYALGGLAPDRATITTSLLSSLVLVRYLFLYGIYLKQQKINFKPLLLILMFLMVGFNLIFFQIHREYSQSVDRRMVSILKNANKVIEVEKLPDAGYLNSAEITTDSTHFLNRHLKYGLGIDRAIVLNDH